MDMAQTTAETPKDFGEPPAGLVRRWVTEINLFEKQMATYYERGNRILRRYRDERDAAQVHIKRLNILWSNIEVLKPAVYARTPKPDIQRRFKDKDDVSRVASTILERAVEYSIECNDRFDMAMRQARDSLLLVGLGAVWQRYVPHMRKVQRAIPVMPMAAPMPPEGVQVESEYAEPGGYQDADGNTYGADVVVTDEAGASMVMQEYEELDYEEVVDDYVHWTDIGWNSGARTWDEVYAVWRRAYLTREELRQRFGDEIGNKVSLDHKPKELDEKDETADLFKKAVVYEIWDKATKQVHWLCKTYPEGPLDTRPDPLGLSDFFPCPRPLFSTLTQDSLIPVPDYAQYQNQAEEIDDLTDRIDHLTSALRMRGLYAGELSEVRRLLQDGNDLDLIPVENWAMYADKGGIANAISWMPLREVAETISRLYEAREQAKQALYEVTGLSDIVRGQSDSSETATAQQIKAQWGSIRVASKQAEIARFARDLLRIKAELIAEHFDPQTIAGMVNAEAIPDLMETVEALGPDGQPVQQEVFSEQMFMAAIDLLKTDHLRHWRIDIETDSTVAPDEMAEKEARNEFLTSIGGFLNNMLPLLQAVPQMAPAVGEMMMFAVRGYSAGQRIESAIEQGMQQVVEQAMAPPPPPPPPEPTPDKMIDAQLEQQRMQMEQQRFAVDTQIKVRELQQDQMAMLPQTEVPQ